MAPTAISKTLDSELPFLDMAIADDKEPSNIRRCFQGATVFLTGGTGFLGKLLIEKLLRCCPEIKRIYVLTRPKKGVEISARLEKQFNDVIFARLTKKYQDFPKKIEVMAGDMMKLGIGMDEHDRNILINDVDFIFHCAATVRFDEPLKTAVLTNVRGTRELLKIASSCRRLKAMVHVSTAYSNCTLDVIDEKFYDVNLAGEKLINLVEGLDDQTIENITAGLVGAYPNTYTYTKAAAENIVIDYLKTIPIAVIRPSIVTATAKEPIEGWIDNINGPSAVGVGAGTGVLHVMQCDPCSVVDLVPGDLVINVLVAAAWRLASADPSTPPPLVYMAVSSPRTPLTWGQFGKLGESYANEIPPSQAMYRYLLILEPSKFWYSFYTFIYHWIPAYIIDGVFYLIGREPQLRKIYTKIDKLTKILTYFALNQWKFINKNTMRLYNELNVTDQEMFNFDFDSLDWSEYLKSYMRGMRLYLLKESPDTIPEGRKKQANLRLLHNVLKYFLTFVFVLIAWHVLKLVFWMSL